jgi:two-component system, chemotaxis family, chemotaxis protein CheY
MKKKILVVDDSNLVRNYHSAILKDAGFEVFTAIDGYEALEKSLSKDIDLILCDVNMGRMDGISFVEKYRKEGLETPIIMISTQSDVVDKFKAYQAGANVYILKPVQPDALIENIKILLD